MFDEVLKTVGEISELAKAVKFENDLDIKIGYLCTLCEHKLTSPYAIFLAYQNVVNLKDYINALLEHIKQYQAAPNANTVANIETVITNTITIISKVPILGKGETVAGVNKALEIISGREKTFEQELEAVNTVFKTTLTKLDDELTEIRTEADSLKLSVAAEQQRADSIIANSQAQFTKDQGDRGAAHLKQQQDILNNANDLKDSISAGFEDFQEKQKNEFEALAKNKKDEADELISQIAEIKVLADGTNKEIQELYGIVSGNALVGSNQKYANDAQEAANGLFKWAIAAMIFALLVAIGVFWRVIFLGEPITDWKYFVFRVSFIILALLPAAYFVNEAKKQRSQEYKFRDAEVKMEILPNYFNKLDDCDGEDILKTRLHLAELIFTPDKHNPDNNHKGLSLKDLKELISILRITE